MKKINLKNILKKTFKKKTKKKKQTKVAAKKSKIIKIKKVKNMNKDLKIKIIEVLWKIVYSDNNPDMYENSLMRRLAGLLYLDPKIVGDTKQRIINNLKK